MNPLVKKEIRLLLPSFLIGVVLTFSNLILPDMRSLTGFHAVLLVFPFLFCPAMAVMMALNSFGAEVSSGTFSNLLAQPVPRARIWQVKILLLAAALFIVGFLWCFSFYLRFTPFTNQNNPQNYWDMFVTVWTFIFAVFSGGLWTVLLLRQVAAAFWFTLLTPGAILVLTINLMPETSGMVFEIVAVSVLGIYTLVSFWFARWLFLRAQDTQWTGGTIAMPEMRGLPAFLTGTATRRCWRPRAALWWKEIQLHQSQFIMAGVLALLHLGVLATRRWGHFGHNSSMGAVLDSFWCLWLVMPLLVGCAAMAEERKMGTLAGQLCLPVKRRTQFGIKVLVVLMFSVVLGIVMPWLLEGNRILPEFHFEKIIQNNGFNNSYFATTTAGIVWLTALNILQSLSPYLPFLLMAALSAGMSAMSFYASTLARNTLQALAPAVLGLLLTWFLLMMAAMPNEFGLGFLWRGPLVFLIVTPAMIAVLAALAYGNCQRISNGGSVWLKNLLTLGIALSLATTATSAIYHRAWEVLSSVEPPHGVARWTIANPPRMQINGERITVFLPDGRVWMNRYDLSEPNPFETKIIESRMFGGGKFLEGTNWTDVQDCWRDIVGIQRDGSLWVSETPDNLYRPWLRGKMPVSEATKLARFGDGNDWKNISGRYFQPFLLKTDGTLWFWGTNHWDGRKDWPGLHAFLPQRLGTDSDWEKIFTDYGRIFFFKTNGQIWVNPAFAGEDEVKTLAPNISASRASFLENKKWKDVATAATSSQGWSCVGVFEDGTFRQIAVYDRIPITPDNSKRIRTTSNFTWGFVGKDVQIGKETNWLALAVGNSGIVTLKTDGTLWKWYFDHYLYGNRPEPLNLPTASPTSFSAHSDWVAIGRMQDGIVSLAADGSLCLWRFNSPNDYGSGINSPLLAVSRRPIILGNVFGKSD